MTNFFPRHSRSDGDEPTDLSQVQADDALIESLRQQPLFGDTGFDRTAFDDGDTIAFSRSDAFVGANAFGPGDAASSDAQVSALLRAWQQEIDSVPMPPPIDLEVATAVIKSAPPRRRAIRPMIAVACAIAGLLVGSAAIGARSATPEDTLWPVTQLLWGDRADSVLAAIDAREGINKASTALAADNPSAAAVALDHVTVVITKVQERDGRETLDSDLNVVQSQLEQVTADSTTSVPPTTTAPATPGTTTDGTSSTSPTPSTTPSSTSQPVPPPPPSSENTTPPSTPTSDSTTETTPSTDTTTSTTETTTSTETTETSTTSETTNTTTETTQSTETAETATTAETTTAGDPTQVGNESPAAGN